MEFEKERIAIHILGALVAVLGVAAILLTGPLQIVALIAACLQCFWAGYHFALFRQCQARYLASKMQQAGAQVSVAPSEPLQTQATKPRADRQGLKGA